VAQLLKEVRVAWYNLSTLYFVKEMSRSETQKITVFSTDSLNRTGRGT
jgi:hypothetical protein